jgi:hypothetical protein
LRREKEKLEQRLDAKPLASGTAPLNPTSGGVSNVPRRGYSDYGEMYEDLKVQENIEKAKGIENGQAKQILDAMFRKMFKDASRTKSVPDVGDRPSEFDGSIRERFNRLQRKEIKGNY